MESLLLLHQLGYAPQSFKREQERVCRTSIGFSYPGIIGQTRCNVPVIAIRHADDEIGVRSSTDPNELHALAMQGVRRMGHGDPFQSWLVKGGSVL